MDLLLRAHDDALLPSPAHVYAAGCGYATPRILAERRPAAAGATAAAPSQATAAAYDG